MMKTHWTLQYILHKSVRIKVRLELLTIPPRKQGIWALFVFFCCYDSMIPVYQSPFVRFPFPFLPTIICLWGENWKKSYRIQICYIENRDASQMHRQKHFDVPFRWVRLQRKETSTMQENEWNSFKWTYENPPFLPAFDGNCRSEINRQKSSSRLSQWNENVNNIPQAAAISQKKKEGLRIENKKGRNPFGCVKCKNPLFLSKYQLILENLFTFGNEWWANKRISHFKDENSA